MTPRLPIARIHDALQAWVRSVVESGHSLNASSYMAWRRSSDPSAPAISTVLSRLGEPTWGELLLAHRGDLGLASADDVLLELPFRCRGVGIRWRDAMTRPWVNDATCRCHDCKEPAVVGEHAELALRLDDPDDGWRAVTAVVRWRCEAAPDHHRPIRATAAAVATGRARCHDCVSNDRLRERHRPGSALPPRRGWRPRSPADIRVADLLHNMLLGEPIDVGWAVVLAAGALDEGRAWFEPSFILPDRRVAVVIGRDSVPRSDDIPGWRVVRIDARASAAATARHLASEVVRRW